MKTETINYNIKVGQIYEVTTEFFLTSGKKNEFKRPVKLILGEKIEIRFPFCWHFRTEDNHYFHAETEIILNNSKLIGLIYEQVRYDNHAKLDEILKLGLYNRI